MPRILIADDQYEVLAALKLLLKAEGFETAMANSPRAVLELAGTAAFDLVLIDLNYTRDTTSGREGLDLISRLRQMPHVPPVIVMTAWSTVPLAVEAMRLGAVDFIEKPWDNQRLLSLVRQHTGSGAERGPAAMTAAADLEIARAVQNRLLPQVWPTLRSLDYAVRYQPAGLVGGDYYDFLNAGPDSLVFVVADVSGKGISAAILMATVQSYFRSRSPQDLQDLTALVQDLNDKFYNSSTAEHYATLFVMRYCDSTQEAEWINCGHTPPLLCQAGKPAAELGPTATVIGMFPEWSGTTERIRIGTNDSLLIFSDGLVEAVDEDHVEFGNERLFQLWDRSKDLRPVQLVAAIGDAIREYTHGTATDDLTIVALRGKAAAAVHSSYDQRPISMQLLSEPLGAVERHM